MKTGLTKDKREQGNNASENSSPAVQPKLTVGAANDKYEQEADAMADKVTRSDQPFTQQKGITPADPGTENSKQASDGIQDRIASSAGSGTSLDSDTRSFMETQLGADLGQVKIHTDSEAVQMSRDINAKAFTTGRDIYFNEGQYKPGDKAGKQLLAHELTHVVQQGAGTQQVQRTVDTKDPITVPTQREGDICQGWESDPQSLTIDLTRFHFRTKHDEVVQVGSMDCESGSSVRMKMCKITLTDGRNVRVMYSPEVNVIRIDHDGGFCRYSYTCSETGAVTYTELECSE
jgi:hypothetical protein